MQSKKNWYNLNTQGILPQWERESQLSRLSKVLVMAASILLFFYKSFHVKPGWDQQSLKKTTVFCEL